MLNPIRMRRTAEGSLDGATTRTYTAGETYHLPDTPMHGAPGLREVFLREGWAEEVMPIYPAEGVLVDRPFELTPTDAASAVEDEVTEFIPADSLTPHRCQAITGGGTQCKRDAVEGSDFCALPAHQAQGA